MHFSRLLSVTALLGLGCSQGDASKQDSLQEFRLGLVNHTRTDEITGYRWRCRESNSKEIESPLVEDCLDVIAQYKTTPGEVTIAWTSGCYKITSGTCTGSICPQKMTPMVIAPALLAQYFEDPILEQCISNGYHGWWTDTKGQGIGLYLS
ncbi:Pathogen effector [Microdochium nivale]|nr:Pathogen effector [Microdochium nivale]